MGLQIVKFRLNEPSTAPAVAASTLQVQFCGPAGDPKLSLVLSKTLTVIVALVGIQELPHLLAGVRGSTLTNAPKSY